MGEKPGDYFTDFSDKDLSARLLRVSRMLDQAVAVLNLTVAEIKGKDDPTDDRDTPTGEEP